MSDESQICPYCQRQFASANDLGNHMRDKRRVSAAHGLLADGKPRPRSVVQEQYEAAWRVKESLRR